VDIPFFNKEQNEKQFSDEQVQKMLDENSQMVEDKILRNLNLATLFDDLEEQSAIAKFLPYLSFILSVITLIFIVAKD